MKLQSKLTLFNAISKLAIVVLFVLLLPRLIANINQNYNDNRLRKQENKVMRLIKTQGIGAYIQNGQAYGSYTMLKEEYISLDAAEPALNIDTIADQKRLVERDTIDYRILSRTFKIADKNYLLEIGKSVSTVGETNTALQSIALQVLLGMILLTVLADVFYSNYILRPLGRIITTKLIGNTFPNFGSYKKVRTTTSDFQHLDKSIHEMIVAIESAFHKEREFISNASHELMTPISIMQSKIENMFNQDEIADDVKLRLLEMQKILNRLKSITKTLLLISQIENAQFLKEDSVSIQTLIDEVYNEISIRLEDKNIRFDIAITDNVILTGVNKFLLFNMFFNLINNAIKYNNDGGEIMVKSFTQDGCLVVEIAR